MKSAIRPAANLYAADCPSRSVLDQVTSRWGLLILVVLLDRTHRFSELSRRIGGFGEKMLAESLRKLVADGLVLRTVFPTIPPKVEYSLTGPGREVGLHMQAVADWVEEKLPAILRAREKDAKRV